MILPYEAAKEIDEFLSEQNISYVIIGGIAVQRWGDPRLTKDVDVTLIVPIEKTQKIISLLTQKFRTRIDDFEKFVEKTRVLPSLASNGCEIDFAFGLPGYEELMFERSVLHELSEDIKIPICSSEDLIIHKAVAGRAQDLIDLKGIINRQAEKLDVEYIRVWLTNFSQILETDEVLERFEKLFEEWKNWKKGQNQS